MNISLALKTIRFNKGFKQVDVCRKANISQTYMSQIENGQKQASIDVLRSLCKVYGIPYSVLAFMAMEEKDVQKSKMPIFKKLKPAMDELIAEFLK